MSEQEKIPIMKQLSTNIGYIVGIIGFAGIVWSMASKAANKDFSVANLKEDVTEVKQAIDRVENKIDTASAHYKNIELKQNDQIYLIGNVIENQEALKTGFEKHLKLDKRYEELVQFLEDYKFDVQKAKEDSLQYKIRVTPKK